MSQTIEARTLQEPRKIPKTRDLIRCTNFFCSLEIERHQAYKSERNRFYCSEECYNEVVDEH